MRDRSIGLLLLLLLLAAVGAGCGRIGFEVVTAADGGTDVPDVAEVPVRDAAPEAGSVPHAREDAAREVDDAGVACDEAPCRLLLPQCGCASGQMCSWDTTSARECAPLGATPIGGTCTSEHACVPGAGCMFYGPGPGVCFAFCDSTAECGGSARCVRTGWSGPVGICSASCDPIAQTGCSSPTACGSGLAIEVVTEEVVTALLCANLGPGGPDAPCSGPLDCGAGLACWGDICRPLCRMGDAATCSGSCEEFEPRAFIGAIEYGACV